MLNKINIKEVELDKQVHGILLDMHNNAPKMIPTQFNILALMRKASK
jgi:hypothetical protein